MAKTNKHVRKRARRSTQKQKRPSLASRLFGWGDEVGQSLRSSMSTLRQAGEWPLLECMITKAWREPGMIVQLCVARRSPKGEVAVGMFLVDLGCLGVKNAYGKIYPSVAIYKRELLARLKEAHPMQTIDLDLAAKIVAEAVRYADSLGFKPNKDIKMAYLVMGEASPETCDVKIPLGKDGKPFFVNGPYDDVDRIRRTLDRTVGPGNYEFLMILPGPFDEMEFDPDNTIGFG